MSNSKKGDYVSVPMSAEEERSVFGSQAPYASGVAPASGSSASPSSSQPATVPPREVSLTLDDPTPHEEAPPKYEEVVRPRQPQGPLPSSPPPPRQQQQQQQQPIYNQQTPLINNGDSAPVLATYSTISPNPRHPQSNPTRPIRVHPSATEGHRRDRRSGCCRTCCWLLLIIIILSVVFDGSDDDGGLAERCEKYSSNVAFQSFSSQIASMTITSSGDLTTDITIEQAKNPEDPSTIQITSFASKKELLDRIRSEVRQDSATLRTELTSKRHVGWNECASAKVSIILSQQAYALSNLRLDTVKGNLSVFMEDFYHSLSSLRAETVSGSINVRASVQELVRLNTVSGSIQGNLTLGGSLTAQTTSGQVELAVRQQTMMKDAMLSIETTSGEIGLTIESLFTGHFRMRSLKDIWIHAPNSPARIHATQTSKGFAAGWIGDGTAEPASRSIIDLRTTSSSASLTLSE